jgi:hypothetical protein
MKRVGETGSPCLSPLACQRAIFLEFSFMQT